MDLGAVRQFFTIFIIVLAAVCMLYSVTQSFYTIWLIFDAISSMNRFSSRYGTVTAQKSASRHTPESPSPKSVEATLLNGLQRGEMKGYPAKKIVATILLGAVLLVVALVCTILASSERSDMQISYISQVGVMIGGTYVLVACELMRQIKVVCLSATTA